MFGFRKSRNAELNSQYATRADYCRIFQQEMRPLYLLSFLLTANHARAEQCYIRLVFSESDQSEVRDAWHDPLGEPRVSSVIDVVTRLAPLERFVFVMSVLERYSDRECSVLLNCMVKDVIDARLQALRALAGVDPVFSDAVESQSETQSGGRTDRARSTKSALSMLSAAYAGREDE